MLDARVKNSSILTGYLRVTVPSLPESASGDDAFGAEGIVPAEFMAVSNFAGHVLLQPKSASADKSREKNDNTTANTRLNPSKR